MQRDRTIHYCQQFGLDLLDIYRDERTGKELNRPGIQAALARVVETGAMLIAVSLCRISRSVGDWHHLLDAYFDGMPDTSSSLSTSPGSMPRPRRARRSSTSAP